MSVVLAMFLCLGPAVAQEGEPAPETAVDDEHAKELYAQGEASYAEGEYEDALKYWQAAYELSQRPLILYNMASAFEKLAMYPEAISALDEYWRYAPSTERSIIERRIKNLEAKLEPGQASPSTVRMGSSFEPGWILVGIGAAGIGAGSYYGLQSRSLGAQLDAACPGGFCESDQAARITTQQQSAARADISLAVGIVAAGAGVTLVLIDQQGLRVSPTPNGLMISGRFQ